MAIPRFPVRVVGCVAAETDAASRRVVRLRWPGAIDWGDVARISAEVVSELRGVYFDEIELCVVAAGSPCQDFARLNASGAGLRGAKSSVFFEVPACRHSSRPPSATSHGGPWRTWRAWRRRTGRP